MHVDDLSAGRPDEPVADGKTKAYCGRGIGQYDIYTPCVEFAHSSEEATGSTFQRFTRLNHLRTGLFIAAGVVHNGQYPYRFTQFLMLCDGLDERPLYLLKGSVVEEQAQALIRKAFSTSVREAGDLSAGVYNRAGLMLAQAVTGTPGHVNAMADAVAHFIRDIGPDNIFEGDIYITNDPWMGTGHLHDITVVTPSFYKGRHVGFFACTAHVVDIGGRGFGADSNSVYEEGLYIPIMKLSGRCKVV